MLPVSALQSPDILRGQYSQCRTPKYSKHAQHPQYITPKTASTREYLSRFNPGILPIIAVPPVPPPPFPANRFFTNSSLLGASVQSCSERYKKAPLQPKQGGRRQYLALRVSRAKSSRPCLPASPTTAHATCVTVCATIYLGGGKYGLAQSIYTTLIRDANRGPRTPTSRRNPQRSELFH